MVSEENELQSVPVCVHAFIVCGYIGIKKVEVEEDGDE